MSDINREDKSKLNVVKTTKPQKLGDSHLMRWERLFKNVKDACVSIEALDADRASNINGSGFIIKEKGSYYIITAASIVIKDISSSPYNYIIWDEIYALISGINGTNKSRYYRLKLLAIDGVQNLAIMEIPYSHNNDLPKLHCHTHLKFSQKNPKHGQLIAMVNYSTLDHQSILTGIMVEPHHIQSTAMGPQTLLLCNFGSYISSYIGAPIFDASGHVIGVHIGRYNESSSLTVGTTNRILCQFVHRYFNCSQYFSDFHYDGTLLSSTLGSYSRYLKGFIGIRADIFGSEDDLKNYLPVGQNWPNRNVTGAVIQLYDPRGGWIKSGLPNDKRYVLLKINGRELGTVEDGEISVADITWDLLPGEKIKVVYCSLADFFTSTTYVQTDLTLEDWPTEYDVVRSFIS